MTTNAPLAWALAARPKTLSGAAAPVVVGCAAAYADGSFHLLPAVLCLLFALFMQVTANYVNDYVDFMKKRDREDRLGPDRACAQGWITPHAMKRGIAASTLLSCLCGLPLVLWGGWAMLAVGALCVVFCFLYSTSLSGLYMGDLLVLVFFGLVPVCLTYYLQTGLLTTHVALCSLAMGMVTDTLLVVNNYRDIEQDEANGKRTLAVALGRTATQWLYLLAGLLSTAIAATSLLLVGRGWLVLLLAPYVVTHIGNHRMLTAIGEGRGLNKVLGLTGAAILLFALGLSVAIIL